MHGREKLGVIPLWSKAQSEPVSISVSSHHTVCLSALIQDNQLHTHSKKHTHTCSLSALFASPVLGARQSTCVHSVYIYFGLSVNMILDDDLTIKMDFDRRMESTYQRASPQCLFGSSFCISEQSLNLNPVDLR